MSGTQMESTGPVPNSFTATEQAIRQMEDWLDSVEREYRGFSSPLRSLHRHIAERVRELVDDECAHAVGRANV